MMMEDFSSTQLRAFIRYEYDGVTLDLRLKGLSNFPDAVTELSELEVLRLNGNNLTELPTSINKLKNLKRLYLHNNKLSKVPVAVTELSELEELWLSGNNLTELPTSINKLKNLKRLDLTDNKLSKVPDAVTELSELKDLWLNDNNLTELPTSIGEMKELRMLSVPHNPFTIDGMRSLLKLKEKKKEKIFIDITVPAEIEARGPRAQLAYQNALRDGAVRVYHGRLLLIGQDRAGKTSLKKSLLGQPFEPKEQSTEGIEVDPSTFQVDVDNVKNWQSIDENKQWLLGCFKDVARMVVEKLRVPDKLWDREEKDREKDDEQNIDNEAEKEEDDSFMNQVADPKIDTDSVSEHTSAQPELMVDTTSPPDEITKHAIQLIKYVKGKRVKEESVVSMEVWDFAGQHLYYASHPIFFSPRAIYILVFNLSKSLNATAQPCVRQGTCNIILDNPNEETNMENLQSWLSTVHSITPMSRETNDKAQRKLPHLHPPVFIVGTHADKPFEDIPTMKSEVQGRIAGKEYEGHVVRPIFSIDNTARLLESRIKKLFWGTDENIDAIQALQNKIMEVLRQESYMGEKIPMRWLNFEKIIDALLSKQIFHMNVKQLQTYAKDVCFITDKEEFITMLNFYHDLGMIIKHHSTVILKAQWLIDLFRQLITIPHFNKADREVSKHWKKVEDTGVLHMELVDHVFEKFLLKGVVRDDILNMMEQFGLIAKYSPSTTDVKYFVPAQLKAPPDSICAMMPSNSDPCPLYVYFVGGFVPHGLFTRLVSHFICWCSEVGPTQPPTLYQNGAWFVTGKQVVHDFILTCKKQFIKVVLKQRSQSQPVVGDKSTDHEVAVQVREFVDGTLQSLSRDLPYLQGLQYKFHVECPYCGLESEKCTNHSEVSCAHEDCLHLLEITQGNPLICKKKPSNVVLRVDGLEKWFSQRTIQELHPSTSLDAAQSHSGETLKVALLANEWGSSKGGLSTINRTLAILLAKHSEVQITLLVPEFECSEKDKRAAKSHNIFIREVQSRPGYDPLDWLISPSKDLAIDVVIGHGAKLGRQAQFIRESHCCKWVQVVHTEPEELAMHKNYPSAIAKGQEKNRAEVDLCKLADLVVAIGPKLAEAFSSYLRFSDQNVFPLTPGTFLDFANIKHSEQETAKFKVLTFGRGDSEDLSLKGYDIAASAIVELKDSSYRLIFVGAPEGKEDEVADTLLKTGISRNQLFVRPFVQNKERLKELFCEVDVAIMPSRTEGFGLTALEAMSAGLPILVSGNSGFGEALCELPFGMSCVIESEDPKDWAKAIAALRQKSRTQRLQEIKTLRRMYEEKFSWERQCKSLVERIWKMVHGSRLIVVSAMKRSVQNFSGKVQKDGLIFNVLQQMKHNTQKGTSNIDLSLDLKKIASDKGFMISGNQGGGNCVFHALSEQLDLVKGIKISHQNLRHKIVHYLKNNPKLPDGTELFNFVDGYSSWNAYLASMAVDGTWGDHVILHGAANCFGTSIHVISSLSHLNDVIINPEHPVASSNQLVLGHVHELHYVSLIPPKPGDQ